MAKPAEASFTTCLVASLAWSLWSIGASALELSLPRGAQEAFSERSPLDSYALPTGPWVDGTVPFVAVEGEVLRQSFHIGNDSITPLQVLAPIRQTILDAGYTLDLDCDEVSCGGFEFRFAIDVLPAPAMFVDITNYRFLSARRGADAIGLLISATATQRYLQVIQVGASATDPLETAPIPPDAPTEAPDLASQLEQSGRLVLDDLAFESGRTELSQGPYASLSALAAYLEANPGARVALVGHTDAVGGLEGNIAISEARAAAVSDRLISTYGVNPDQITAQGIGFLSPRDSNLSDAGRARNRRVEAVLTEGG